MRFSRQTTPEEFVENVRQAKRIQRSDISLKETKQSKAKQLILVYDDGSVVEEQPGWGFTNSARCNHMAHKQCSLQGL